MPSPRLSPAPALDTIVGEVGVGMMRHVFRIALLAGGAFAVSGCETLPEGTFGEIGRDVFGEVAGSASVKMIRDTADSMCSSGDAMCRFFVCS